METVSPSCYTLVGFLMMTTALFSSLDSIEDKWGISTLAAAVELSTLNVLAASAIELSKKISLLSRRYPRGRYRL